MSSSTAATANTPWAQASPSKSKPTSPPPTPPKGASKLGQISSAQVEANGHPLIIVNAYTQNHWRGKGILADYAAIRAAMRQVKAQFAGKRIGYPKIGAGLARGDWATIAPIIDEELAGEQHTLVIYEP